MDWQEIKNLHLSEDVQKIIDATGCDNCSCKDGLLFSKITATILCSTCSSMIQRILTRRNERVMKIEKMQRDCYGCD